MAEFSSNIGEGLIKAAQELDKGRKEIFKEAMAAADTIDKAGSEIDKTLKKTKKKLEETELQLDTLKAEFKDISVEVKDPNFQQKVAAAIEKAANAKPAEIKAKARINTYIDSSSLKGQSKDILDEVQGILEKAMSIKGTKSQWKGFNLLKVLDVDDLNVDALEKKLKKLFNKKDFGDKPLDDKQLTAMFSAYQTLGGQKFKGYEDLEGYISSLTKVKNGGEFYQSIINATKELIPLLQAANSETEKLQKNTSKTPTGLKSGKTTGGSTGDKSGNDELKQEVKQVEELIGDYKKLLDLKYQIKNVDKSSYSGNNSDWIGIYSSQKEAIAEDLADSKEKLHSSLNLILSEDKQSLSALEEEANRLKASLQPVQDMVNRISSNSSITYLDADKGSKNYAEAYKAIDDRLGELNQQYSLTNEELEEYITLQVKAEKIMDRMIGHYGGVQGSGVKNKHELKTWIEKSFARDLGLNPEDIYSGLFGNITDALYDGNGISLFDSEGTKRNLREVSAEILKYKSITSAMDGAFGANEDAEKLREINVVLNYIKKNADEIESTDFTTQIKKASEYVDYFSKKLAEGEHTDYYSVALEEAQRNLQELIALQERLNSAQGKKTESIIESNKQEIASNEEVIASEEKKRKLKIANKDYLANRQEAQSSTETADVVVANNERTQESANKTAQVVEDAANRIVAAEEKIAEGSKKKNKGLNTLLDEHSKPISDNVQALIDKKLSEIKDTVALDGNAKYKITTDADDSPVGVNITYKDKDTQSMITEMYSFKAATEETEEEYEGLVLKRKEYSKDEIKLAEQRVQSEKKTQKEIERSDSFLEKQKRTITNIQQLYDKDINPNAQKGITNVSDLKDLRDTYSSILEKINALKGTKVSQSIKDDLLSQINDFENKRKSYTAKWYGATDLSPKELSVNKDILTNNFDAFISEAKLAGTYTSDLVIKVEEFKKTINSIDSSVGLKTAKDQLMEYRSELKALIQEERVRISQEKANKSDYNENYKTIQNYEAAQDKLNKLLGQQAKGNSSNELKEKIKIAKQEVFDLKIEAIEASKAITSMFKSGSISKDQKTNAQSLLKNVNLGNTDSSSTLAATLNDSLSKHDAEIIDITAKYEKLGYTTDEITEKFKKLNTAQQEANNSSNSSVDERLQKELKYQEELNKLKIEASQIKDGTKENTSSSVQNALKNTQQLMSQFANSDMTGFDRVFTDAQSKVNELNKSLQTGKISTETYTKKIQEIASGMSKVVGIVNPNNITQAEEAMRNYASTFKNVDIKKFNDEAGTLTFRFEEQKGVIKEVTLQYDQMTGAISKVKEVTTTAQTGLQSFLSSLKGRAKALVQYLATFASFYRIIAIIRQGITVIKDLDTALTEMRKVSNESVKSLKEFQKVSFDVANSIGSTAKQIQESAADFMRLGYELNTASELAKDANIYANVGDMEIGEATEHMISSIQAWKSEFSNEVEASAAIIDRYNEIGNNFAITSADIGSAMERSAAALKAGGKVYCHDI